MNALCLRDVPFAAHIDIGVMMSAFASAWTNTTCRFTLWCNIQKYFFPISFRLTFPSQRGKRNDNHQCKCSVKLNKRIRMYITFILTAGESVCRRQSAVRYNGNFSLVLFALELNNSGVLLVCALITDKIRVGKLNCYQPLFVIATSKCL